ncbi:hypothetical protein XENORESO_001713 [Xenotaenia resolanae]|uniref:Uncharacterized protein n=1 Tax=Xenotaenia resolanae TaxID=208358 RepID=A0ABV0WQI1_9TELE
MQGETRSKIVGKSPIKLQFTTFGKADDPSDPLQYLERCEDFLALNPLTDEELMATLPGSGGIWHVIKYKPGWNLTNYFGLRSYPKTKRMSWLRECATESKKRMKASETLHTYISHYANTGNQL